MTTRPSLGNWFVKRERLLALPLVPKPIHALRFGFRLCQRRQQHARQDCDYRDDDQQFDERKGHFPMGRKLHKVDPSIGWLPSTVNDSQPKAGWLRLGQPNLAKHQNERFKS
jgi:hypothetical protein